MENNAIIKNLLEINAAIEEYENDSTYMTITEKLKKLRSAKKLLVAELKELENDSISMKFKWGNNYYSYNHSVKVEIKPEFDMQLFKNEQAGIYHKYTKDVEHVKHVVKLIKLKKIPKEEVHEFTS